MAEPPTPPPSEPDNVRHSPIFFKTKEGYWKAILRGSNIYVQLPNIPQAYTSTLSLTLILEVAEEELKCDNLVLLITPDIPDRPHLINALRTNFGFQIFYPEGLVSLPASMNYEGLICMIYNIQG